VLYSAERLRSGKGRGAEEDEADARGGRRGDRAAVMASGGSRRKQSTATLEPPRELDRHGRELPPDIASDVRLARLSKSTAAQIGAAQILGLFPGLSRSGATMVAGIFKGLHHEDAARFAFLLATPVILLAGLYKLPELAKPENSSVVGPAIAGSLVAFVASYLSVRFLVRYFETRTLTPFAIYCLVVGLISVVRFA
jgi:undecaprenyl pyrophosphate phosphatase UppP